MSIVAGSSLAEARELYNLLSECMSLLDQLEEKTQRTTVSMTRLLVVTNSLLIALNRSGYGKTHQETIQKIRFVLMMLQRIQTQAILTNIALSSGPLGMVLGVIGIGLTVVSTVDMASMVI